MPLSGAGRRAKGAAFEREVADSLRSLWLEARRNLSQTRSAAREGGDILDVAPYHVECKRGAATIQSAMRQAARDCGGNIPVVISRQDRGESLVTMRLDDWKALVLLSRSHEALGILLERLNNGTA